MSAHAIDRRGLAVTAATFVIWGVVPLYWHLLKAVPALQIMAHRVVWSALLVVGWLLLRGEGFAAAPTAHGTLALLYLAVFGSIIAFSSYVWLLHHVRPVLASSYAYVNPAIAVALGAWLAGERFTTHDLGAMAVILAGVVIITLAKVLRR